MSCSEARGAALAGLAAALLLAGCATPPALQPGEVAGLGGENGLWVEERGARVRVSWITDDGGPGWIEVMAADGTPVHRATTRRGPAHRVAFRPGGHTELVLRYGSREAGPDRHRTRVRLGTPPRAPFDLAAPDTLFVVGDTHGRYVELVSLLRHAGLVDGELAWSGGRAHLVVLGDIFDRGERVHAILWLLYRLEEEARGAGGGVHVVLGNHELMALTDDLDYVAAREMQVAELHGAHYSRLFDTRWSVLGRWLASRPGVMRVGEILLAHGGVAPPYDRWTLPELNDSLHAFMHEPLFHYLSGDRAVAVAPLDSAAVDRRLHLFEGADSPLWHRGYVQSDTLGPVLRRVLEHHGVERHAVAHTPVRRIHARYGGALVAVHPPVPASEMLRVVRDPGGARYEVLEESGSWRPLGEH